MSAAEQHEHILGRGKLTLTDIKNRCVQGLLNKTVDVSPSPIHLAGNHHGESVSTVNLCNSCKGGHFCEKERGERLCGAAVEPSSPTGNWVLR